MNLNPTSACSAYAHSSFAQASTAKGLAVYWVLLAVAVTNALRSPGTRLPLRRCGRAPSHCVAGIQVFLSCLHIKSNARHLTLSSPAGHAALQLALGPHTLTAEPPELGAGLYGGRVHTAIYAGRAHVLSPAQGMAMTARAHGRGKPSTWRNFPCKVVLCFCED